MLGLPGAQESCSREGRHGLSAHQRCSKQQPHVWPSAASSIIMGIKIPAGARRCALSGWQCCWRRSAWWCLRWVLQEVEAACTSPRAGAPCSPRRGEEPGLVGGREIQSWGGLAPAAWVILILRCW